MSVIFLDPMKLIISNLVQLKYLEHCKVLGSDPLCFEFLRGPRAHAETSEMTILEFLSSINDTIPNAFQTLLWRGFENEEEKARVTAATKASATSKARACSRATSRSSSHTQWGLIQILHFVFKVGSQCQ